MHGGVTEWCAVLTCCTWHWGGVHGGATEWCAVLTCCTWRRGGGAGGARGGGGDGGWRPPLRLPRRRQ